MYTDTSLSPQFVIFHYFIKYFIAFFGSLPYFIFVVGGISALCIRAIYKNIKADEWDRAAMVGIFSLIVVGGLIGLGIDVSNGYSIDTLLK